MKSYQSKSLAKPILKPLLYGVMALSVAYSCKNQDTKTRDCPESCVSVTNSENVTVTHNHYHQKNSNSKKLRKHNKKTSPAQKIVKKIVKGIVSLDTVVQEANRTHVPNNDYNYDYYGPQNGSPHKLDCFRED